MLCVHEVIKVPAKLVTIVKPDEILSPSLYVWCSRDQKYITAESSSTWHWLNDHQRRIVVQGDGDHDLCTGGSYVEVTVVLTSTQASQPSNRQWTCTTNGWVEGQGDGTGDHYTGGWCADTMVLIASKQSDHFPMWWWCTSIAGSCSNVIEIRT
jgi:hypothetical protein